MTAGTAIWLFRWLANHEGFTLELVKLLSGIGAGLVIALEADFQTGPRRLRNGRRRQFESAGAPRRPWGS